MTDAIDLMLRHRSIRRFRDEPVDEAHLAQAIAAGQAASTSSAVQAYSALRVRDPGVRAEIADLAGGQAHIVQGGAFLLFLADTRRHRLACEDAGLAYDQRLEAFLVAAVDTALFAQNVALALESLGYGICYVGGLRNDLPRLESVVPLPEGVYPVFGMSVGVPAETPLSRPRLPVDAVYFDEAYPSDAELRAAMARYDETYVAYMRARGAKPRGWASKMAHMLKSPRRAYLARFFAGKGARLD